MTLWTCDRRLLAARASSAARIRAGEPSGKLRSAWQRLASQRQALHSRSAANLVAGEQGHERRYFAKSLPSRGHLHLVAAQAAGSTDAGCTMSSANARTPGEQRIPARTKRVFGYVAALGIGVALVAWAFPPWAILGMAPPGAPDSPDYAVHVVGQRYFLLDHWHWPLLVARALGAPLGTNIGLTDSLPFLLLVLRPFASVLPAGFQAVTSWLALCWMMQPVAAVFALRGTGERRVLPAIAVSVLASSLPSFLMRMPHAALDGHFTLLLMLGLYLRAVGPGQRAGLWTVGSGLLLPVLLLIHPYLMLMAVALLLAIPATLLARRSRQWVPALAASLVLLANTAALASLLGYVGAAESGGFGIYSMNLLAPFWPDRSALLPGFPRPIDATGGQYEGSQYLGAGVLALGAIALLGAPKRLAAIVKSHAGLVAACLVLTVLALSNRVYAGHALILSMPTPQIMGIVRASGRLFWPVAYIVLIGSAALLLRAKPRYGPSILLGLAALQFCDASTLLYHDRIRLNSTLEFPFAVETLRGAMLGKSKLNVIPVFPCEPTLPAISSMMQIIWVASETGIPTNTVYSARPRPPFQCNIREQAAVPLADGEIRVLLPGHADLASLVPGGNTLCSRLNEFTMCSKSTTLGLWPSDGHR